MNEAQRQRLDERLRREQVIWLATTRRNRTPHLIPIWYAWDGERIFVVTQRESQKVKNIEYTPKVAVSLPDGFDVVIIEGDAAILDGTGQEHEHVSRLFKEKYDWGDWGAGGWVAIAIRPTKFLVWNSS